MIQSSYQKINFSQDHKIGLQVAPYNRCIVLQNEAIKKAIKFPFNCTPSEFALLQKLWPRNLLEMGPKELQHPVPRALNHYYNTRLKNWSRIAREKGLKTICIGGVELDRTHYDHICTKVESVADHHRYSKNAHGYRPILASDKNFCADGAEVCNYKASVAYAIDSMYDVPFYSMPQIFEQHQINELYFTMHLPHTLYDNKWFAYEGDINNNTYYYIEVTELANRRILRFSTKDGNPVYEHDYDNLYLYLTVTAIHTLCYTISIEVVEQRGIYYLFRAVKSNYIAPVPYGPMPPYDPRLSYSSLKYGYQPVPGTFMIDSQLHGKSCAVVNTMNSRMSFPRTVVSEMDEFYVFPDLTYACKNVNWLTSILAVNRADYTKCHELVEVEATFSFGTCRNWKRTGICIPKKVVQACNKFAHQYDFAALTPKEFGTYLKGTVSTVRLSGQQIQDGWDVDARTYDAAFVTLYVYVLAKKNNVKNCIEHLKKISESERSHFPVFNTAIQAVIRWWDNTRNKADTWEDIPKFFIHNMLSPKAHKVIISNGLFLASRGSVYDDIFYSMPGGVLPLMPKPTAPPMPTLAAPAPPPVSGGWFFEPITKRFLYTTATHYEFLPHIGSEFVNASNTSLVLGGGTSGALKIMCGNQLQIDMSNVPKPIIAGNCYYTKGPYNGIVGVYHCAMDPNACNTNFNGHVQAAYIALNNALVANKSNGATVWHCNLGSGIFGSGTGTPALSQQLLLDNITTPIIKIAGTTVTPSKAWIPLDACLKLTGNPTIGDGHCLLHSAINCTSLTYAALVNLLSANPLVKATLFSTTGAKLWQSTSMLDEIQKHTRCNYIVHSTASNTHEIFYYGHADFRAIKHDGSHFESMNCCHHIVTAGVTINGDEGEEEPVFLDRKAAAKKLKSETKAPEAKIEIKTAKKNEPSQTGTKVITENDIAFGNADDDQWSDISDDPPPKTVFKPIFATKGVAKTAPAVKQPTTAKASIAADQPATTKAPDVKATADKVESDKVTIVEKNATITVKNETKTVAMKVEKQTKPPANRVEAKPQPRKIKLVTGVTFDFSLVDHFVTTVDLGVDFHAARIETGSSTKHTVYSKLKTVIDCIGPTTITDLSAAPGALYKDLINDGYNVHGLVWEGEGAFNCNLKLPKYSDLRTVQLIKADLAILDCPYDKCVNNAKHALHLLETNLFGVLILKTFLYVEEDKSTAAFARLNKLLEGYTQVWFKSNVKSSSEVYVVVTKFTVKSHNNKACIDKLKIWSYDNNIVLPETIDPDESDDLQIVEQQVKIENMTLAHAEMMKSDVPEIVKIGKDIEEELKLYLNDFVVKCKWFAGVSGAGKSHGIQAHKPDIIVTSTKENVEYIKHNPANKAYVTTPHTALKHKPRQAVKTLVIDEAQEISIGLLGMLCKHYKVEEVICVGDPAQIKPIDFQKLWETGQCLTFPRDADGNLKYNRNASKRCPSDVAAIVRNLYKVPMVSVAKQTRSVFSSRDPAVLSSCTLVIAPTQETKQHYKAGYTIHKSKGMTSPVVGLVIESQDDYNLVTSSNYQWSYVGITRHTDAIVIVEPNGSKKFYNMLRGAAQANTEETPPMPGIKIIEPTINEPIIEEPVTIEPGSLPLAIEALEAALPTENDHHNIDLIEDNDLGEVEEGVFTLNPDVINAQVVKRIGKGYVMRETYRKFYNVRNWRIAAKTMVNRYSKNLKKRLAKELTADQVIQGVEDMWHGMLKWTVCETVRELKESLYTSADELSDFLKEYLCKLQDKLNKNKNKAPEIRSREWFQTLKEEGIVCMVDGVGGGQDILDTTFEDMQKTIDFFMKHQGKFTPKPGWDAIFKAGQGISAVNKGRNIVYAALARAAEDKFVKVLRPEVKITFGESEINYKKWYKNCIKDYDFNQLKKFNSDAEQWDSSLSIVNNLWDAEVSHCVLHDYKLAPVYTTKLDVPTLADRIINIWDKKASVVDYESCLSIRGLVSSWTVEVILMDKLQWRMVMRTNKGSVTLTGKSKKFSGEQNTAYGNTQNNMAQIGSMLRIYKIIAAMFKGDDSSFTGEYEVDPVMYERLCKRGMVYKIDECDGVFEYIGFIIHADGWMPDIYRRGANLASRSWPSKVKYEESIIGLKDLWSIVETQVEADRGIEAAASFYEEHTDLKTNEGYLRNLYNWQQAIMCTPWEHLKEREMLPFVGEVPSSASLIHQ